MLWGYDSSSSTIRAVFTLLLVFVRGQRILRLRSGLLCSCHLPSETLRHDTGMASSGSASARPPQPLLSCSRPHYSLQPGRTAPPHAAATWPHTAQQQGSYYHCNYDCENIRALSDPHILGRVACALPNIIVHYWLFLCQHWFFKFHFEFFTMGNLMQYHHDHDHLTIIKFRCWELSKAESSSK